MIKKRIFALTVMICVIAMGVVYGKWTKRLNVGLETKSGVLKYEIGDISNCKVSIVNDDLRYDVPAEQIEFAEGSKELVIKVSASKLKEISGDSGKITGIDISYAAKPSDKNTIYSVDVDKDTKTHIAEVFSEAGSIQSSNSEVKNNMDIESDASSDTGLDSALNTASNGEINSEINNEINNKTNSELNNKTNGQMNDDINNKINSDAKAVTERGKMSEMINSKIKCITETSSEYKINDDEKYLEIGHNTKLEDYEYKVGDIITIEYDDVIEQLNKDSFVNKTGISTTHCLWSQKLKLQCRILITE